MPEPKDIVRLRHMRDYAREAVDMIRGRVRADLDTERQLNLALVRLLEVVGEAAVRVTARTRETYPDLPWSQMAGLRNRLIHGYDAVDFDILWDILTLDLPTLIQRLDDILQHLDPA